MQAYDEGYRDGYKRTMNRSQRSDDPARYRQGYTDGTADRLLDLEPTR